MEMLEKVAYLKGLAEGLGIDDSTKEGKVLGLIIDLLDDVALTLADVGEGFAILGEQLDSLDEDIDEIMEDLYEDEEEDCCCGGHHHHHGEDDFFDGELYEVTCPSCGDIICVDEDMLDEGEINCPGCGELLEFDFDGELEEEDVEDKEPKK